ncbi:hypothetical protein Tco_1109658 [Tanacetum coccineum]
MSEDLTYSMLHEMLMKKFNLEANFQLNLSFKLSSFDYTVDITDDAEIRTFCNYLRHVLMIDAAHLKGLYKGTNLVVVAMDGNNQIVPFAFGICNGETVEKEFPLAFHHDAYQKLCEAGIERWSRAHCPVVWYNYMTSNSVESVNAKSVIHRKELVLKLAEMYRTMVQEWYYKRRQLAVAGKLQIFVSHNLIDLSTVLIPNDGSLEESFAVFKVKSGVPCQVPVRKEDVLVLIKAHGDIISILWAPKPIRVGDKRVNFVATVGDEKKLKLWKALALP